MADAYKAYAYFRWVDDTLDSERLSKPERIAFVKRQSALIDCCDAELHPHNVCLEETMLVSLLMANRENNSGLRRYVRHMMAVMEFDAKRRGNYITNDDLGKYERHLSVAVTEALHHFIGHGHRAPQTEARYLAARGAHITHMLRDTVEDMALGYFNIPSEYLKFHRLMNQEIFSTPYRAWVKSRVHRARECFSAGREYLSQVQNPRCRLAGYLYISRFEHTLDAIEQDGYCLRSAYTEPTRLKAGLNLLQSAIWQTVIPGVHRSVDPAHSREDLERALR
jgi:phytoene/squalene synthetase